MTLETFKSHLEASLQTLYTASECRFLLEVVVEKVLSLDKFQLKNSLSNEISPSDEEKLQHIIALLAKGLPYQQVLGEAIFYGETFYVNEHVLIPRPETEELLEKAIEILQQHYPTKCKILDIGTGSGIIPIILKKYVPHAEITTLDISKEAIDVAKKNAQLHKVDITFTEADYLSSTLTNTYDVIISNPPYIGIDEAPEILDGVKNFEPNIALFSPTQDALIFYKKIAKDARKHLEKNGYIFLEINQKLGVETLELYQDFTQAELLKDISGNDRIIIVTSPEK